ncbi:unnamed protein product [[Candida] boidinii]|uniref:Unnamed protein product n=1 Tax=Candida boidinii TaxID=5477 RepID=A0ACB5U034_CANBO|nr:unnamed protein product [[Candida] boidinii]
MIFQNWINWVWVLLFVNCYYSYSISKDLTFNNDNIEIEFDDKYLVFDTKLVKRKSGHASSGHGSSGSSGSSGHGSSGGSSHGSSGGSEGSGGSSGGSSGHTGNSGNSGNSGSSGSSGSSGGSRGHVGQDISSSGSGYSSGSRGQSGENAISGGGSRGHQTGYSSRGNYYTSNTGIKQHGNYNGNPVYSYSSRRSSYSSTSRYTPRYFVGGLAGGAAAGYLLGSGFGFYHWGYYPYYPFGYHYYHHSNTTNEQITNFEPLVLSNSGTSMLIDLQIGDEKLIVQLDTSSSDLWFIDSNNVTDYEGEGLLTISDSTKSLGTSFTSTNYDNITGDYYSDTILVNDDFNLTDFQFAVVDLPSSSNDSAIGFAGVLGIGPKMGESSYITEGEIYDNFIFKCYNEKLINKPVYSIYLNTSESEIGSFLLGAVDIAKILDTDNFITLPLTSLSGDDKNISML